MTTISKILAELRFQACQLTGPDLARLRSETIAECRGYRLTLEIPADPDGRLSADEPEGPWVGVVVTLRHGDKELDHCSLWGIFEDLDAGCSIEHPFWEHLADCVRQVATEATEPGPLNAMFRLQEEQIQRYRTDLSIPAT